ncbi:MAG: hypothetical protein ACXU9W_09890 [Thermodesulfobacteriota bacterium]
MNQRITRLLLITLFVLLSFSKSLQAAGKPDVTRHEAHFLESTVNVHVEWQSPNPVVLVKISVAGVEKEIKIDAYDNKRNRDGYAGETNVNLGLERAPHHPFSYVIQLEDELRIKSPLVTGKVDVPEAKQPGGRQVGTIIVILGPSAIVNSGAMWRVENGPWKKSGESISDLRVGAHTIEFQDIGNWIKPEKKNVKIEAGKTVIINETYKLR